MITVRKAEQRGHFTNSWLESHHSFSFGDYHDPDHMGVSVLRVINDDIIAPGAGFPMHPHNNMEIVTYLLEGELAHKDSMGNGSVIRAGDVQRMSAGTGVTHSEFNPSELNAAKLLQIWLLPSEQGIQPGYDQRYFAPQSKQGLLKLLVSSDGRDDSIQATTDALVYSAILDKHNTATHQLEPGRIAYLHIAKGDLIVNGLSLKTGDGATISQETEINLGTDSSVECLLFDLPA